MGGILVEDAEFELKDLLNNPRTVQFSRIKYLASLGSDDQIRRFVNELFLAVGQAMYDDEWDPVVELLERWEDEAIQLQFDSMEMPAADEVPWTAVSKPLSESKFALVTTGGVYVEGQTPFERQDTTFRVIDRDTPTDQFHIWHPGYDHGPAEEDINCIFPVDRFRELEAEGILGSLSDHYYSWMGLIDDTDTLSNKSAPEAALQIKEAGVDAVFLAST